MTDGVNWRGFRDGIVERAMHPVSTLVFTRALTFTVLLKVLWQWPSHAQVLNMHRLRLPAGGIFSAILFPARFANEHPHVFFSGRVVFLVMHLAVKRNVFTASLFSLLSFNLLLMNRPTGDGGDLVAFMLSLWAILMIPAGATAGPYARLLQSAAYNAARIGCLLQFVFLYLGSGIDKLKSNVWTTGQAFNAMRIAGGIINPEFPMALQTPVWDAVFTWTTIVLEIGFGVFVWFRRWQPALIVAAIMFHLGIWWMFELRDFALIMIVAVLLFIRDDQYAKAFRPWLLSR